MYRHKWKKAIENEAQSINDDFWADEALRTAQFYTPLGQLKTALTGSPMMSFLVLLLLLLLIDRMFFTLATEGVLLCTKSEALIIHSRGAIYISRFSFRVAVALFKKRLFTLYYFPGCVYRLDDRSTLPSITFR